MVPWTATWAIAPVPPVSGRALGLASGDRDHARPEGQEVVAVTQHVEPDQPGHVLGARPGRDITRGSALHDPSLVEHQHPVGEGEGVDRVMGHQQAHPVVRREVTGELEAEAGRDPGVQTRERLVHEQEHGVDRERPGDRHPLGLAARQLARPAARRARRSRSARARSGPAHRPRPGPPRASAVRTRRCRGPTGAGRACPPGTPARPGGRAPCAAGRSRTRRRPPPRRRPAEDPPALPAASTCRRRWARSRRPPRRGRR